MVFAWTSSAEEPTAAVRVRARKVRAVNLGYRLSLRSQLGGHLVKPFSDLATNRFLLDAEQKFKGREYLSAVVGGRVRAESAYAANDQFFSRAQAQKESSEVTPRDIYLQAKGGGLLLRLGYQQVVWGEAFGFFFADLVNPKDLREATLSGLFEQADLRNPIPLANFQWMGEDTTLQLIFSPVASKHQLPSIGSPFLPLTLGPAIPLSSVTILNRAKQDNPIGDYGGRISHRFGSWDFTLLGFSYIDRMPYYEITSFTPFPFALTLQERQKRVFSSGATMTVDFDGWLLRTELVRTQKHRLNYLNGTQLAAAEFGESVAVIGLDTPAIGRWTPGFQISTSILDGAGKIEPAFRKRTQSLAGLRLAREFENGQSLELFAYANIEDHSSLTSLRWTFANSSQLEYLLGVESLQGTSKSEFGSLHEVGRVMIGIKGIFDG